MSAWMFLTVAIALEVVGTVFLKLSDGFEKWHWGALSILCYICCFWAFAPALKAIPVGVAYALWAGIGILAVTLIGFAVFQERLGGGSARVHRADRHRRRRPPPHDNDGGLTRANVRPSPPCGPGIPHVTPALSAAKERSSPRRYSSRRSRGTAIRHFAHSIDRAHRLSLIGDAAPDWGRGTG